MSEVTQPAAQETPNAAPAQDASAIFYPEKTTAAPAAKTEEAAKPAESTPAEAPKAEPGKEQAEAKPATKPEADAKAEAKPGEGKETKPASEQKPVVPEKYDLKLPKDSPVKAERLEKIASFAKEQGLSNDQAQALVDRENEAVSQYVADLNSAMKAKQDEWQKAVADDKELGGDALKENAELAKRVIARYGSDSFKKELNTTGLGNHPELVRLLVRLGKSMSEDQLVIAGQKGSGKKSAEELLYGSTS